jgi:hypothetical protein
MKYRYGLAFLGLPLILLSVLASADGIPDRGNEHLDEMDLTLLRKYANSPIDRSPAQQGIIPAKPLKFSVTVSAIDKRQGGGIYNGSALPPSSVPNQKP